MRRKVNALVEENFKDKDEEEEKVKDMAILSVTTMGRTNTSQETVKTQ